MSSAPRVSRDRVRTPAGIAWTLLPAPRRGPRAFRVAMQWCAAGTDRSPRDTNVRAGPRSGLATARALPERTRLCGERTDGPPGARAVRDAAPVTRPEVRRRELRALGGVRDPRPEAALPLGGGGECGQARRARVEPEGDRPDAPPLHVASRPSKTVTTLRPLARPTPAAWTAPAESRQLAAALLRARLPRLELGLVRPDRDQGVVGRPSRLPGRLSAIRRRTRDRVRTTA